MISSKSILITGCAGFIGFHLAKALRSKGEKIIGLDNFNSYYDPGLKRLRQKVLFAEGISILEADLLDQKTLVKIIEDYAITHIVHLAAQAGVRYSLEDPQAYINSNISGFLTVLETCRQFPHLQLIYASSSSVYGLNKKSPFSEHDRTDHQASLYGVTKKTNELMAETYFHLFGIKSKGLRFFTVYGPWGRPDMAYFQFSQKILEERPIQLFNNGNMQRDFTYIDDIVQGIIASIDHSFEKHEVFNLGNNSPVALKEFLAILEDCLGKKAIIELLPMQQGDVESTFADIEKAEKWLKFSPKTSLEEGLKKFTAWLVNFKIKS